MISCTEATARLWEYLDETLGEADRRSIDEHLDLCRRCCGELEFAKELRHFLADSASEKVPPEVIARLNVTLEQMGDQ
jgi:mycothiol system anti-sigma-R factor